MKLSSSIKGALIGLALGCAALAGATGGHWDDERDDDHPHGGFALALIGDLPYSPTDVPKVDTLIEAINADRSVRFTLHAGDIKGGSERCDDALIRARHAQLQRLRQALVYTPGDNEWTDCHRLAAGSYLPTERLGFLRQLFFAYPGRSGGQRPIRTTPQSHTPGYESYVENVMFMRRGVLFANLHVVGSSNGLAPWNGYDVNDTVANPRADRIAEVKAREQAALAWIDRVFDEATAREAAGVLLQMQANPGIEAPVGNALRNGFEAVLARLKARALAFGKPVLLAQGDNHELLIDTPLYRDAEPEPKLPRFTRVQGFGSPRIHWVKVQVEPRSPEVFRLEPKLVKGNE